MMRMSAIQILIVMLDASLRALGAKGLPPVSLSCSPNLRVLPLSTDAEFYLSDEVNQFLQLFTLLYADGSIIMAESEADSQRPLDVMKDYCQQFKLVVNTEKN